MAMLTERGFEAFGSWVGLGGRDEEAMRDALADLYPMLARHFDSEAAPGGFLEATVRPRYGAAMAERLQQEHERLVTAAFDLLTAEWGEASAFFRACRVFAYRLAALVDLEARLKRGAPAPSFLA